MKYKYVYGILVFLVLLLWILVDRFFAPFFIPNPSNTLKEFTLLIGNGELVINLLISLTRALVGFSLASLFAVSIGIFIGWNKNIYLYFEPFIEFFRALPMVAIIPYVIFILGIGEVSKFFIISFACFWPIFINTIHGVKDIDPILLKVAKTMNLKPVELFYKIVLPATSPSIFTGMKISLPISLILMVTAEMMAGNSGLGFMIVEGQRTLNIEKMTIGILTVGLLGYLLNKIIFLIIDKRLLKWYYIGKKKI